MIKLRKGGGFNNRIRFYGLYQDGKRITGLDSFDLDDIQLEINRIDPNIKTIKEIKCSLKKKVILSTRSQK